MKCRAEDSELFEIKYGDLIRPEYRILPSRGWGQCTNRTTEYLIVYGPKHEAERSIFDTSPYVLPPGATTPNFWDCDGFLLPRDRAIRRWRGLRRGPLALKFWNHRHFSVWGVDAETYHCSWTTASLSRARSTGRSPTFRFLRYSSG